MSAEMIIWKVISPVSVGTDFIGSDELNVVPIEMDLSFI